MSKRIAYLVGAKLEPKMDSSPESRPRAEYERFVERNECTLIDYNCIDLRGRMAAKALKRRSAPHAALAAIASGGYRDHGAYIVSGEDVGLPLALFTRLRGIATPIFVITHGSYFRSPKFKALMRLVRRFSNVHYMCLAESLRATLCDVFGVPTRFAHNTGYGVDTEFFRPGQARQQAMVASAGTATRDYRTLVDAVRGLTVDVRIAADSAWFPTAVDIAGQPLPDNVEARSYGNYQGLRELYAAASLVAVPLHPAKHACGFAVIIEAMAMGKPVIATKIDALTDFIIEGRTGFHVPPHDAPALRERISYLLSNPDLSRQMGRHARCLIEENYSLDAYCSRIESVVKLGHCTPGSNSNGQTG